MDPANLVIEWEAVTTRFFGDGPIEIIEYQVILDPVDERAQPWVDGKNQAGLDQSSWIGHQLYRAAGVSPAKRLIQFRGHGHPSQRKFDDLNR